MDEKGILNDIALESTNIDKTDSNLAATISKYNAAAVSLHNKIETRFDGLVSQYKSMCKDDTKKYANQIRSNQKIRGEISPLLTRIKAIQKRLNSCKNVEEAKACLALIKQTDIKFNEIYKEYQSTKKEEYAAASFTGNPTLADYVNLSIAEEEVGPVEIVATLVGAAIGHIVANKFRNRDKNHSGTRACNPYYALLESDFEESQKLLEKLLKKNKNFVINRKIIKTITDIKKEFYPQMSNLVNNALSVCEENKSMIDKDKSFIFKRPNPIRDEALVSKFKARANSFTEMLKTNDIEGFNNLRSNNAQKYEDMLDGDNISIDSAYLIKLLQPKETFEALKRLDEFLEKLPKLDDISIYTKYSKELQLYYPLEDTSADNIKAPIHGYIYYLMMLSDFLSKIKGALISYTATLYEVLDYAVPSTEYKKSINQ